MTSVLPIINRYLLVLSVLVLLINSYEITFLVWSITAFISFRSKYSVQISKLIFVFSVIMVVALFSSFFSNFKNYNFIRDVAYLLKPILGLLIGYNFCKSAGQNAIKTIIYVGVALAVAHILTIMIYYVFFGIKSFNALRHHGGYFDDYEVYILILLLFHKKFEINIDKKILYLCTLVLSISTILYFARTNILQFIILFLALKGYFKITTRGIKNLLFILLIGGLSYAAIYYSNPRRNSKGIESFFYKIKIAPIEAFKTKINQEDWKEFNDNYRSFENIITVRQVTHDGWFKIIFGKGLGSTVDIGREMWTNDGEFIRYVPALHNAYMTLFLKSGLIGVFLLIYSMFIIGRRSKAETELVQTINNLLVGSAIFLILSNWVFMGLYLKLDNKSIFIGFLICYKELILKRSQKEELR